jgi:hypothetical protein
VTRAASKLVVGSAVGAWATSKLTLSTLAIMGFNPVGILKGSFAASMMSDAMIAGGGVLESGSVVSILQSVSALGAAPWLVVGTGALAGAVIVGGVIFVRSRDRMRLSGGDVIPFDGR